MILKIIFFPKIILLYFQAIEILDISEKNIYKTKIKLLFSS